MRPKLIAVSRAVASGIALLALSGCAQKAPETKPISPAATTAPATAPGGGPSASQIQAANQAPPAFRQQFLGNSAK